MSRSPSPPAAALVSALVALVALAGCSAAAPPPKQEPLGHLPSAVTSAQPEWIGSASPAGKPAQAARRD